MPSTRVTYWSVSYDYSNDPHHPLYRRDVALEFEFVLRYVSKPSSTLQKRVRMHSNAKTQNRSCQRAKKKKRSRVLGFSILPSRSFVASFVTLENYRGKITKWRNINSSRSHEYKKTAKSPFFRPALSLAPILLRPFNLGSVCLS